MKPKHFWGWLRPERVLSDVPVSRNWFKTVSMLNQNYTYEIWYNNLSFKQIHIQQKRNQSENDDIPEEPEKLRYASIIIL